MQETHLQHAAEAGAEVWRDALIAALRPGIHPKDDFLHDGETRPVRARLIVGTDGRESQPATLQEFDRSRDPTEFFKGGLQLAGDLQIEHALYFFLHAGTGRRSILVQNRPGNFQAYLLQHKDALPRRLSGERDFAAVLDHFRAAGIPATWLEYLTPQDAFATFDNTHRWIAHPMRRNCVPIGDAAAESDPVWGNG